MNGYAIYVQDLIPKFDPLNRSQVAAQRAKPEIDRQEYALFESALHDFVERGNKLALGEVVVFEDLEGVGAGMHFRFANPTHTANQELIGFFKTDFGMAPGWLRVVDANTAADQIRNIYKVWSEAEVGRTLDAPGE